MRGQLDERGRPPRIGDVLAAAGIAVAEAPVPIPAAPATVGYMASALVQATLPHREPVDEQGRPLETYVRRNGHYRLIMKRVDDEAGLPYGVYPRLIALFLSTQVAKSKERVVKLGPSLPQFMRSVGAEPKWGEHATVGRFQEQLRRMQMTQITCIYEDPERLSHRTMTMVEESEVVLTGGGLYGWQSSFELGEKFFNELSDRPVPVSVEAVRRLHRSPLALDLYVWLTYRMAGLHRRAEVPWAELEQQFGSDYKDLRRFRFEVKRRLEQVFEVYPQARESVSWQQGSGLLLVPGMPHIPRILTRTA